MKQHLKNFKNFAMNEKVGVISGISGFNAPDKEDSDEIKAARAKVIADMRREVGSDLPEIDEEEESSSISTSSEENLPTIDIDKILYDYARALNDKEKKEFAKKLSMHIQSLNYMTKN